MLDTVRRIPVLICCDTCSQEFFGAAGETNARSHAEKTGHQVRINSLVRETLNEAGLDEEPEYSLPVQQTARDRKLSRDAAEARLIAIYGGAQ